MIEKKIYIFKTEFCQELHIPMNQAERRLKELLTWLTNFYDFEFLEGHPNRIHIIEIYGEYQPLPRKLPKQDELNKAKQSDYTAYTIASLSPDDYKPNSKRKIARDAIESFGESKYHHTNARAVASRYIAKPFEEYGETNDVYTWVYFSTYEPLEEEILQEWRQILSASKIGEQEASNAFYAMEDGLDISKEKEYYKLAKNQFKARYQDIPVLVKNWRLKT